MAWALENKQVELVLRMANAGWWFLLTYGLTQEGIRWLDAVLRLTADERTSLRARVLVGAGRLAHQHGDLAAAEQFLDEAIQTARSTADLEVLDLALGGYSFVVFERGEFRRALDAAEENVSVAERIGERRLVAGALVRLGEHLVLHGDLERGIEVAQRAAELATTGGDRGCTAAALDTLGLARRLSGSTAEAVAVLERAVELHREFGFKANIAEALFRCADAVLQSGSVERAAHLCAEGLELATETGSQRRIAGGLRVAAAVANGRGAHELAVRLASLARRVYAQIGTTLIPIDQRDLEAVLHDARNALGSARYEAIRASCVADALDALLSEANTMLTLSSAPDLAVTR